LAEETQGDGGAAKLQEGQMDVSPVLARTCGGAGVADLQAPEALEPGERPFDHPAVASQELPSWQKRGIGVLWETYDKAVTNLLTGEEYGWNLICR
jgi:hypothetical protein